MGATLEGAYIEATDFTMANLKRANLEEASLTRVSFEGVNFEKAYLKNVIYDEKTIWTGAKYNRFTVFPDGFIPEEHGMIKVD